MNRNTRTAVVVGVAVLLAAVASLGMYRIVSRMPAKAAEVTTVDVVVAQAPLKLGTRILKDHVKIVRWPIEAPVEGSFAKIEEVLDRGVIAAVAMNEPLTASKLAALEAGAGLPPSIPQGMRAISVKVNEVVGVAGFVVPGTRVDVMVTLKGRQSNDEQSMTRIVCSNVQVLTAGTRYDQEKAKEGNAIPSTVVTLLVKPDDGERIALAAEEGQLMLSLRNPLDVEPTVTSGVRTASLFGQPAPAPAKPRTSPRRTEKPAVPVVEPPPAAPYRVESLKGGKRSEEVVKPAEVVKTSEVIKPSGGGIK